MRIPVLVSNEFYKNPYLCIYLFIYTLIYGLFNNVFGNLVYKVSNVKKISERLTWQEVEGSGPCPTSFNIQAFSCGGLRKSTKKSVIIAGLGAEVWNWDLQKAKQEVHTLNRDVRMNIDPMALEM
jgi:hypothetical protein